MAARRHAGHFTGLYVAQEARRAEVRAGDAEYAHGPGKGRFQRGCEVVDSDPLVGPMAADPFAPDALHPPIAVRLPDVLPADPRVVPQGSLLPLADPLGFRLPQPVSVNDIYRTNLHTGAKYLTDAQKVFRSQVIGTVRGVMRRANRGRSPLLGVLEARVLVSDRLDIDNGLKSLLDALQHAGAYRNDRQIRRMVIDVIAMPAGAEWCEVTLVEIGQ